MSNPRNTGTLIGRLARDPEVISNSDGSHKILFTVFADRNYTSRAGERISDAIPVETFVSNRANGLAGYDRIHKGDLVALQTTLQHQSWVKDGETVYQTKVVVEDMTFLESRATTQARMTERVAQLEQATKTGKTSQAQPEPVAAGSAMYPEPEPDLPFGN